MASLVAMLPLLLCFYLSQVNARDCPILAMLPLARDAGQGHRDPPRFGQGRDPPEEDIIEGTKIGFSNVAAVQMAIDDFNKRDASVVPELAFLPSSCDNVTLSWAGLRDTEDQSVSTVRSLIDWLETKPDAVGRSDVCAIIGPESFRSVMDAAPLAAALDVPMMVYGTQQEILRDRSRAFTSIQANSWSSDLAHAVLSFLQGLERQYLAILQMQGPEEAATAADITRYSADYQIETHSVVADFKPVGKLNKELVRASFAGIQETGHRTVLFAGILAGVMSGIADVADELGMLDGSYLFVFLDEFTSREYFQHETAAVDGPLDKMLGGSVVISLLDGFELDNDQFLGKWKQQRDVDTIAEMYARASNARVKFRPPSDFFQTELPGRRTTFLYDSVVAVGMGLCAMSDEFGGTMENTPMTTKPKEATLKSETDILPGLFKKAGGRKEANGVKEGLEAEQADANTSGRQGEHPPIGDASREVYLEPNVLYKSILENANFHGASGYFMKFLEGSFVRDPKGLAYGAFNVHPRTRDDEESHQQRCVVTQICVMLNLNPMF
jgi:hypothetical protein